MRYKLIKEYPGSPKLNSIYTVKCHINNIYYFDQEVNVLGILPIDIENNPEYWKKVIEKCALFTTEDGIDVYAGDYYTCIDKRDLSKIYSEGKFSGGNIRKDEYYFFSTKVKAQKYIDNNKPLYSKQQIINVLNWCIPSEYHIEQVKNHIKRELKI